ncbi:hypothetical protein AC623_10780 [Bacillus sp. FJAT-27231]|uniref:hypothetical protein n=1 Tax=Bacillus sp. FJAT-27231 TaxID=1679168 RepID=UPI000670FDD4|nr:hypothetical protein [Bacillus sp. FJAT-27231]KMY54353.1 hypothetical protein AC623_10780 [Bacillus sp. FJAT-27231]
MDSNFGKYDVPPTLQRLIDLQNALGDLEQFYLGLNFYLSLENFRYFNTPSDVVVFGNMGVDGVHYGFLTDYSSVTDLEIAPIVCICPMDFERPTRIVAKNLCEFLRVNLTDGELFYNQFNSEESYLAARDQWAAERANSPYQPSENEKLVRERVTTLLMENLQIPTVDNPYRYVQNVQLERQRNISIQTQEGLGVTTPLLQHEKHIPFPIQKDTGPDLELLQEYLYSAPVASRLALFRNIQLNDVLQNNQELYKIVIDAMINMEFIDEANRLSKDI